MIPKITICMGSSCFARGNEKNLEVLEIFIKENALEDEVDLELDCSLCRGHCNQGPNILVNGTEYNNVDPGMMYEILNEHFGNKA